MAPEQAYKQWSWFWAVSLIQVPGGTSILPALQGVGGELSVEEMGSLGNPRECGRGGLGILGLLPHPASPEGAPEPMC